MLMLKRTLIRRISIWPFGSSSASPTIMDSIPPIPPIAPIEQKQVIEPLPIQVVKIPFESIARFQDKSKLAWTMDTVHAWIHSLTLPAPMGLLVLAKSVFGLQVRQDILGQAIKYEKSWLEAGTESTKHLGQVRGTTRKWAPQKGRGRARVGSHRAPQWRGGYTVHGPRPHDKTTDINRKVYEKSLCMALTTKLVQDQLVIVDSLNPEQDPFKPTLEAKVPHSAGLETVLETLGLTHRKVYFVYGSTMVPKHLIRAADTLTTRAEFIPEPVPKHLQGKVDPVQKSPIKPIMISHASQITVSTLLETDVLVLDKSAIEYLESKYASQ